MKISKGIEDKSEKKYMQAVKILTMIPMVVVEEKYKNLDIYEYTIERMTEGEITPEQAEKIVLAFEEKSLKMLDLILSSVKQKKGKQNDGL